MEEFIRVVSPFDGQTIANFPVTSSIDINIALETARNLADDRSQWLAPWKRREILEKAADKVKSRQDEFAMDIAREGGKPLRDAYVEMDRAVDGLKLAASAMLMNEGTRIPMGLTQASMGRTAFTDPEPLGVVVAISAFNHPFNLIVHQVAPAIAAGCPVIVKPAEKTPVSCVNLLGVLEECGMPGEWVQLVMCEGPDAEKLATDPRVDYLSFIGSAKVGWSLRSRLSPGTKCVLEHGGAAPVLVCEDVDVKEIVPSLVKGAFYHAGQVCVSVQKVFVHESIVDTFCKELVQQADALQVGDPCLEETEVGPIIRKSELERIDEWVEEAASDEHCVVLTGGERIGDTCYKPTVLLNPPLNAKVSESEIFGPVVCVYAFRDEKDAIREANRLPFAFQAAVYTKDIDRALRVTGELNAQAVMVNDHTAFRVDWMPFGGKKHSGLGVGGIPQAIQDMTTQKLIVIKN
jgi:acyl-CoA reductase-like NAD-dependent aldehyde dehydrogenase